MYLSADNTLRYSRYRTFDTHFDFFPRSLCIIHSQRIDRHRCKICRITQIFLYQILYLFGSKDKSIATIGILLEIDLERRDTFEIIIHQYGSFISQMHGNRCRKFTRNNGIIGNIGIFYGNTVHSVHIFAERLHHPKQKREGNKHQKCQNVLTPLAL